MEYHGVKIDLLGLGAVISAITTFYLALKGQIKKEKNDVQKNSNLK